VLKNKNDIYNNGFSQAVVPRKETIKLQIQNDKIKSKIWPATRKRAFSF